jgi:N utilization substance protein B
VTEEGAPERTGAGHNVLAAQRRKARHYALQALYQWQMTGTALHAIESEFRADYDFTHVDQEHFERLLHGIPAEVDALEAALAPQLDRPLDELDPVELTVLRMGVYELMHCIDVPYKVAISEAVALARKFGATDGHKYINGVLDALATRCRPVEVPLRTVREVAPRQRAAGSARHVPVTVRPKVSERKKPDGAPRRGPAGRGAKTDKGSPRSE